MGVYIPNASVRLIQEGLLNTKSWTLPGSATTQTLFTVANGNIIVNGLLGVVTTLIGSTATTLALGTVPTTGTASTVGIATATAVTSAEAGTQITALAASGVAGALVVGSNAGKSVYLANPFIVAPGTITATTSANAGAGVINWYLLWTPLDLNATVS